MEKAKKSFKKMHIFSWKIFYSEHTITSTHRINIFYFLNIFSPRNRTEILVLNLRVWASCVIGTAMIRHMSWLNFSRSLRTYIVLQNEDDARSLFHVRSGRRRDAARITKETTPETCGAAYWAIRKKNSTYRRISLPELINLERRARYYQYIRVILS